jgi:HEAT repeat protein
MDLRQSAAAALGKIGPAAKSAFPALLDALKSDNDHFRYVAASSAVSIAPDDPAVVRGLIDAFHDAKYPEGQDAAALGFDQLGPKAKAALPVLVETVKSSDAPVLLRRRAATALGSMEREARPAVPALAALLRDAQQPPELRATIARSLGALGATAKPAIPVFRDLLHDPNVSPDLANDLVEGLGNIGPDAVSVLAGIVQDGRIPVGRRGEAIRQLGKLGGAAAAALPELETAVKDADDRISELAGWAMSRIKDQCRDRAAPLN